ncbi:MAG: tetratricopeptide repeat protein [Planctomycetales bacterium]|nr:tetratricopeptide repeat protein [Planctomycetales bacterium]
MSHESRRVVRSLRRRIRWSALLLLGSSLVGCNSTGRVDLPGPVSLTSADVTMSAATDAELLRAQDPGEGWFQKLSPKRVAQNIKSAAGYGPNKAAAEAAFQEGETLFVDAANQQGGKRIEQFTAAAKKYSTAATRWPDSSIEEDALFMVAESYFFANRYPDSSKTYELLVKKYPNSRHMDVVDKRRFALAKYWIEHNEANPDLPITPNLTAKDRPLFDKFGHGVRVLDKIRFDDPTGQVADDATMLEAVSHFKQGHYQRADELFTDLRHSFPDSEHQFQAHLLSLQCKLHIYQGPQYSITPMEEAEELVKQITRQFPQEAVDNRDFLNKTWKEVRLKKAEHDYEMAEYYDNREEYAAARQYYQRVQRNYSDTSLARDASEALARIADSPGKPEQPLPWLAKMFPTPEREKPLVAKNPLESIRR